MNLRIKIHQLTNSKQPQMMEQNIENVLYRPDLVLALLLAQTANVCGIIQATFYHMVFGCNHFLTEGLYRSSHRMLVINLKFFLAICYIRTYNWLSFSPTPAHPPKHSRKSMVPSSQFFIKVLGSQSCSIHFTLK